MAITLPYPTIDGLVASGAQMQADLNVLLAAANLALNKDGSTPVTSNINMGGFNFINLADGIALNSAVTLNQLQLPTGSQLIGFNGSTVYNSLATMPSFTQYTTPQLALNAADSSGYSLSASGGVTTTVVPLDIKGKYFTLTGVPSRSKLQASAAMVNLIDGETPTEVASYAPFRISGVDLDGNSLATGAGISVRYRRDYIIENCLISNVPIGVKIKDGNSGILRNVRTSAVTIGLSSIGSNHQTLHDACSFNGASDVGIKVEANGTANDGSYGLSFVSCLAQNNARGIELNYKTQVNWFGGYIGESNTGYAIDNKGGDFTMSGGLVFFDSAAGHYLVHPVGSGTAGQGGTTRFVQTHIAASGTNGLQKLIYLAPGEVDVTKNGKVTFQDCDLYSLISGGGYFAGDVIGNAPTTNGWVPRNGRNWIDNANGAYTFAVSGNGKVVTSTGATVIELHTAINPALWNLAGPLFFIMAYKATKALVIRTDTSTLAGGGQILGVAPISTNWGTFITFEVTPSVIAAITTLSMYTNGNAVSTDTFTLLRAGFADADFVNSGGKAGVLNNLMFP